MKILNIIFLCLLAAGSAANADPDIDHGSLLAVIDIQNNTGEYQAFVSGMPDMLITELLQRGSIQLVERTKIQTAMKALKLEASGLTEEKNLQLGKWVGAGGIIVGVFNKMENKYRLDIRVIDVKKGTISEAASSTRPSHALLELIPDVGEQLLIRLGRRQSEKLQREGKNQHLQVPVKDTLPQCRVQIEYKIILGLLTERPIHFQKVRVFLDGVLIHTSRAINQLNTYLLVFEGFVPSGVHEIRLEHGILNADGSWMRTLEEQPESHRYNLQPLGNVLLQYKMRAEPRWNSFTLLKVRN